MLKDPAFVTEIPASLGCIPIVASSKFVTKFCYANSQIQPVKGCFVLAEMLMFNNV